MPFNSTMLAYIAMMAPRLIELRRVLRDTGSVYLHCDPTASHYLKMLMDAVFGPTMFRNEIVWERTTGRKGGLQFGRVHDVILFYSRGQHCQWNPPVTAQSPETAKGHDLMEIDGVVFRQSDLTGAGQGPPRRFGDLELAPPAGRHWQFDQPGIDRLQAEGRIVFSAGGKPRLLNEIRPVAIRDVWTDIDPINAAAAERLGYQTQKPQALLERIIETSSTEGELVLDPFCGCGTTVAAAQRLNRQWIGIDVTHLAIGLIKSRLHDMYGDSASFKVVGEPTTVDGAEALAASDPYQFQFWALGLVGARPVEQKKGADRGIDGRLYFNEGKGDTKQIILSVKADHLTPAYVRDLRGVVDREGAQIGVLISFQDPTQPMRSEAAGAGLRVAVGEASPAAAAHRRGVAWRQGHRLPPRHGRQRHVPPCPTRC